MIFDVTSGAHRGFDFLGIVTGEVFSDELAAKRAEGRAEWLMSALGELTPKQRFVVECAWGLRDGVEYSFPEIASIMGVRWEAVRKHYRLGMRKLEGTKLRGL